MQNLESSNKLLILYMIFSLSDWNRKSSGVIDNPIFLLIHNLDDLQFKDNQGTVNLRPNYVLE